MFRIFRKDDPEKAVDYCIEHLQAQILKVRDLFKEPADFERALRVAACFVWGFLYHFSAKYVRKDQVRWSVSLTVFKTLFGSTVACAFAEEVNSRIRTPAGAQSFQEGMQAARDYTRYGVPAVQTFLEGAGHLGDDDFSREWRKLKSDFYQQP